MEATTKKKTTFLLNKKSCFLLFLFRRFLRRSFLCSLKEDLHAAAARVSSDISLLLSHPARSPKPRALVEEVFLQANSSCSHAEDFSQKSRFASLHRSNSKEENNLSSYQEKLFSSFLVSKVSSSKLSFAHSKKFSMQQPARVSSDTGLLLSHPARSPEPRALVEESNLASLFNEAITVLNKFLRTGASVSFWFGAPGLM